MNANTARHFDFRLRLLQYAENQEYVDCKFICGDFSLGLHKIVVCSQSKVLNAAFKGISQGTQSSVFRFKSDEWVFVKRMLKGLYSGQYSELADEDTYDPDAPSSNWRLHLRMLLIADKYQVDELANFARWRINRHLKHRRVDTTDFFDSIKSIYDGPECMKRCRMDVVSHAKHILTTERKNQATMDKYKSICREVPDFALEMLFDVGEDLQEKSQQLSSAPKKRPWQKYLEGYYGTPRDKELPL